LIQLGYTKKYLSKQKILIFSENC